MLVVYAAKGDSKIKINKYNYDDSKKSKDAYRNEGIFKRCSEGKSKIC